MSPTGWEALSHHIKEHLVEGSPAEMRAAFEALAPDPPAGKQMVIGGVDCVQYGQGPSEPILWLHGGGLVFGSSRSHGALAATVAELSKGPVLVPDYALAPEYPWPAPLDDVLVVMDALKSPVDLAGDSAGGQLALLAALRHPEKVRRLALLSPNTDRTGQSETRQRNSPHDLMNDDADDAALARLSFGDDLEGHSDASPLMRDLSPLPPVWIAAATNEVLLDDGLLLIRQLGRNGVPCEAHIYPGLCHLWMLWPAALPASVDVLFKLSQFFRS